MATGSQSALQKMAADTKIACATSSDITKAANAAHPGSKVVAKGFAYHAKTAVLVHSIYLAAIGGVVVGVTACYLANKYWVNKDEATRG